MLKPTLTALTLLALLACASCAASLAQTDSAAGRFTAALDPETSIAADGAQLTLTPLSDSSAHPEFILAADGLQRTKALIGYISYDAGSYHLVGSLPAELTAEGALLMCIDRPELSRIDVGWVLANYPEKLGVSGTLELCRLQFAAGPATVNKVAAKAPAGGDNHFTIAGSAAENVPTLTWLEANAGDGDNNGEVNIADITPLGVSLGKHPDPVLPADSQERDADYDKNSEVNISDMTPLGRNIGTILAGYAILAGPSAGSLTELQRFDRTAAFPTAPKTTDGELTWVWTGAAITQDTTFQVQPYDSTGVLGLLSDNTVTLSYDNPQPIITGIDSITFEGAPTWFDKVGDDYTILLTEFAVDDTPGNAEPLEGVVEELQLQGMVTTDIDPGLVDGSESLIWYISEGAGLAEVSNETGSKGLLTFHDRGRIVVEAQLPGNFNNKKTISFALMSIDSLVLELAAGGAGPVAVNAGQTVALAAEGTFDFDNAINGNEYVADLTSFVNWAGLVTPEGTDYAIDTQSGVLDTAGAASGAQIRVTCEFPRTDVITLYDNAKRYSEFLVVNIN